MSCDQCYAIYIYKAALYMYSTVDPLTQTQTLYYGNLHNADKRPQSQIIPYSLLYIVTSL